MDGYQEVRPAARGRGDVEGHRRSRRVRVAHGEEVLVAGRTEHPAAGVVAGRAVPWLVDPFVGVIDRWLAADPRLRATVIHERLVADYGFTGHYQRIKVYVAEARRRLELESDAQVGLPGCAPPVRGGRGRAGPGRLGR